MPERATVVMAPAGTKRQHRVDRWFYIAAGLFLILLSVVGFGPSIIDQSRRNAPPTPLVIAHGIVAGAWVLLFLTQATLVATRQIAVHRRLGIIGPVLAVIMIVLGYLVSIDESRRGYDLSGDLARAFATSSLFPAAVLVPLAAFLSFGVLVAAALWYRHRSDIHKRLMLLAVVLLAREPIAHLVGHLVGYWPSLERASVIIVVLTTVLLLSVSAIHDRVSQGRVHPVSLWVPIVVFAWLAFLNNVVRLSVPWGHEFAAWLTR